MSTDSPAILSQSVLAWLLQATGLLADDRLRTRRLRHVSGGTVKTALAGEPIPARWHDLVREVFAAFGREPAAAQLTAIEVGLRDWDQRASTLDGAGLSARERLPGWLRLLAPQIGIRFGALSVLAEPRKTAAPDIQDWLCEPLSPRAVGRAVEWLFRRHKPGLKTWDLRERALRRVRVNARTVEHWRAGTATIPNTNTLIKVASLMGSPPPPCCLGLLRCARALTKLRADISDWGGPVLAERFAELVASYARVSRGLLANPAFVAHLGDFYALALDFPTGAGALERLRPFVHESLAGAPPADVAAAIRSAAGRVRDAASTDDLGWVIAAQAFEPASLLLAEAATQLGALSQQQAVAEPLDTLQADWKLHAVLDDLANGRGHFERGPSGAGPDVRSPSPELRELAARLVDGYGQLWRRADEPRPDPADGVRLSFLIGELFGPGEGIPMVDLWNRAADAVAVPAALEVIATDEMLARFPHLLAERARRLAAAGQDGDAADCLKLWLATKTTRSRGERVAAADAAATIAHGILNRVAGLRQGPRLMEIFHQALATADQFFALAGKLLNAPPGSSDDVHRLVALLPLAARLDDLHVRLGDATVGPRAASLAGRLVTRERALPDHGPAWAVLALWQELTGDDPSLSRKRAEHFGSADVLARERARFVLDGRLSKDAD